MPDSPGHTSLVGRRDLVSFRHVARTRTRLALRAALRFIPDRAFSPLRTSFSMMAPASPVHSLQRSLLQAARYRGVPPEIDSFVLVDNSSVRLSNADSFIVEWLYWFGEQNGYEAAVIHWWKRFCASSSHIVEFGSNIGYYIVQGAPMAPDAHYTAVEPHPGCAALCRRNIELNGITNAEVVEAAAVPDVSLPTVELVLPGGRDHYEEAPCGGFVGVNDVHDSTEDRTSFSTVTVPTVATSSLVDPLTDLIKMDVEGQEHSLLVAMLDQLKASRPTIFVELLDTTPHLRALILEELLPAGYLAFVPTKQALLPLSAADIAAVSAVRDFGTRDIILTTREAEPPPVGVSHAARATG